MKKTKKIITIHQPDFLPWIGFFHRWAKSDLLIILDDVQFLRRGWHHRDKIKTANGVKWLTLPVEKKGKYSQTINCVQMSHDVDWRNNHLNLIHSVYGKAPEFNRIFEELNKIYFTDCDKLIDFNMALLNFVSKKLKIDTPVNFSTQFNIDATGTEKLAHLVKKVDGTDYLTGMGAKDYLEEDIFLNHGIHIIWHEFNCPVYPQLYNDFLPNLSILDALMMLPEDKIIQLYSGDPVYAEMCA